jgi:alpha-tubulin suppressor-like RCC1 family protein
LGNADSANRQSPAPSTGLTNIVQATAGGYHTFAINKFGDIYAFGLNNVNFFLIIVWTVGFRRHSN